MPRKIQTLVLSLFLVTVGSASVVLADNAPYVSPSYQFNEYSTNPGGGSPSSPSYQSFQSIGDTTIGNATGSAYQSWNGFNTTTTPYLEASVAGGTVDIGILSTASTAHTSTTFYVRTYLASGYVVQTQGVPPTAGSHQLTPLTSGGTSTAGTEQFGMNLVANTIACGAPANFGAAPSQQPDSTFSFGAAATGYNTCGNFKYHQGDTIASSNKSSGETLYTISYIENISNLTPAGIYSYNQNLVVTSTF